MIFGVAAGAPTASLWVNSLGNVGLGTENPLLKLHMVSNDTPAIRFEQTNAGGFTAQTWDIGANEANFFVRDMTNGTTLPFRIRPGAPTSSIDIAANGFVGFGTASPTAQLHTTGTMRFQALSGCGAGLATDADGYVSCLGATALVKQSGPGQPITVGAGTDGTQVAVNGTAGNRTITGVLAGTVAAGSTEAINGGQLYTANQRVAAAFGGGAGLDVNGQLTAPSYTVQGTAYNNVGGAVSALDTALSRDRRRQHLCPRQQCRSRRIRDRHQRRRDRFRIYFQRPQFHRGRNRLDRRRSRDRSPSASTPRRPA